MTGRVLMTALAIAGTIALPRPATRGVGSARDDMYQVSTLHALAAGDYDGRVPFREVQRHGDFGLGTFDALDGELVVLNGRFYRVRSDGSVTVVRPNDTTPFAAVTRFESDETIRVLGPASCQTMMTVLEQRFRGPDLLYAIRIAGTFERLETRSVPPQQKPYVPLVDALANQVVFSLTAIDATMVGFWLPDVLEDVNVAGFHFHAISSDGTAGGHVLDCVADEVIIDIDRTTESRVFFGTAMSP
jgi:acetolactate decarboxylase